MKIFFKESFITETVENVIITKNIYRPKDSISDRAVLSTRVARAQKSSSFIFELELLDSLKK